MSSLSLSCLVLPIYIQCTNNIILFSEEFVQKVNFGNSVAAGSAVGDILKYLIIFLSGLLSRAGDTDRDGRTEIQIQRHREELEKQLKRPNWYL